MVSSPSSFLPVRNHYHSSDFMAEESNQSTTTSEKLQERDGHRIVTRHGETPLSRNRIIGACQSLAALVPVGISFGILQFSFRQVYWRGTITPFTDQDNTSELLGIFQLVAKAHELLVGMSLSWVLLYQLQQELISTDGIPFGVFTSAYRVILGSQPFWLEIFSSWRVFKNKDQSTFFHVQWRALRVATLLSVVSVLILTTGPASASALIPKLDWWYFRELFVWSQEGLDEISAEFSLYIQKPIFPSVISENSLSKEDFCLNSTQNDNSSCSYTGLKELQRMGFTRLANDTIGSYPARGISTSPPPIYPPPIYENETGNSSYDDWQTWVVNYVLPTYSITKLRDFTNNIDNGTHRSQYTVEVNAGSEGVLNPTVGVRCSSQPSNIFQRDLQLLRQFSDGFADIQYPNSSKHTYVEEFDLRDIWNETTLLHPAQTLIEWREIQINSSKNLMLTAFLIFPPNKVQSVSVSICSVGAYYAANKLWISPESGSVISDYIPNSQPTKKQRITIRKGWVDSLNAINPFSKNSTSHTTMLAKYIDTGMSEYRDQSIPQDQLRSSSIHSILLSRALANGVSRIGSEYISSSATHNIFVVCQDKKKRCGEGPILNLQSASTLLNATSKWFTNPRIFNGTWRGLCKASNAVGGKYCDKDTQIYKQVPYSNGANTNWTKVSFPIYRRGYGWGFDGTTIKVATVILSLHALIILIHIGRLLYSGRVYSYAGTLADLLALALKSAPPSALRASGKGGRGVKTSILETQLAVREIVQNEKDDDGSSESHFSITLDDGIMCNGSGDLMRLRRVKTGRSYN